MCECDSDRVVLVCCVATIFLILFVVAAGLAGLLIWATAGKPTCTVKQFEVAALSATSGNSSYFSLNLHNRNKEAGVYYDTLTLSFYYEPDGAGNRSSFIPAGSATVHGFHQGGGKDVDVVSSFAGGGGAWKKEALKSIAAGGKAVFRVDLKTAVRYKVMLWKTKVHRMEVGGDVTVDRNGSLVLQKGFLGRKKKGVKLTSAAGVRLGGSGLRLLWALLAGFQFLC